jgi:cell division septation protein DedD
MSSPAILKEPSPPAITIAYDNGEAVIISDVPVTGELYINGQTEDGSWFELAPQNTEFRRLLSLPDGSHTLELHAVDADGDKTITAQIVSVDTTPPTLLVETPASGGTFGADALLVRALADADALYEFKINGALVDKKPGKDISSEGLLSHSIPVGAFLGDAHLALEISATDESGNTATKLIELNNARLADVNEVFIRNGETRVPNGKIKFGNIGDTADLRLMGITQGDPEHPIDLTDTSGASFDVLGGNSATLSGSKATAAATGQTLIRGSYNLGGGRILSDGAVLSVMEDDNSAQAFSITSIAGSGGSISPSGNITVVKGSAQTFAITSDTGHHILDVMVDGKSVGAVSSYTFINIEENHSITASFAVSEQPAATPTRQPTSSPTNSPAATPANTPTAAPTNSPATTPTNTPTATPTGQPTAMPAMSPAVTPTKQPTTTPAPTSPGGGGYTGGSIGYGTSAMLDKSSATFLGEDIAVTLAPGSFSLSAIKNKGKALVKGKDYTIGGAAVSIKKEYLESLAAGLHTLAFEMSGGINPSLAITIPVASADEWNNAFIDVDKSAWYYNDVKYACENGLFFGTSDSEFSPRGPMTRGMLVTVLGRLSGVDAGNYKSTSFSDAALGQYYTPFIEWAKANGIAAGIGNNRFAPDTGVSRQELCAIVYRYAGFKGIELPATRDYKGFRDDSLREGYAKEATERLYKAGIIEGKGASVFDPKGPATRAEVAAILHRFAVLAGK